MSQHHGMMAYDPLCDTGQVISSVAFGPNISRRLGTVLGVNVLPPGRAACTYNCLYCPLSPFLQVVAGPEGIGTWPEPGEIEEALLNALEVAASHHVLDALVLIGNGEPTLHPRLPEVVEAIARARDTRAPGARLAAFTNSSLLWREEVAEALSRLDYVVVKLDAVDEGLWRTINRPHPGLPGLRKILEGLRELGRKARSSGAELVVSVMLLGLPDGGNTSEKALRALSSFLLELQPDQVHIEVPAGPVDLPGRPASREELFNTVLALADALGDDRVSAMLGTTVPMPAGLLRAAGRGPSPPGAVPSLTEEALALLTFGRGGRTRTKILEALLGRKMSCNQLAKALGMSWWSIQRHLERLLEAGLVKTVRFGRRVLYTITPLGLSALSAVKLGEEGAGLRTRLL